MKKRIFYSFAILPIILFKETVIYAKEPTIGKSVSFPLNKDLLAPEKYKTNVLNETYANESIKIKETQGWFWGSESKDYPTKAILIYNVGVIEAPYIHNAVGYLPKGTTYEVTTKKTDVIEYSKEVAISTQNIYKASLSAEGNIYAIKAIADYENDTQIKIESKVNTTYKSSSEESIKVTIPINESGYYFDDFRATYNLYQVQEYRITNTRKESYRKQSGWAVDVFYDITQTCECVNISYICEFISLCGRCIVKYNQTKDGTFVYDGPKSCKEIIYI